jgi:fructokinase
MMAFLDKYQLEVLVVTNGEQGATAVDNTGLIVEVFPETTMAVVDTVGAGDAFAAGLLLGLNHGWSLSLTMNRAQSLASALVTTQGATVSDPGFYQPFIESWNL